MEEDQPDDEGFRWGTGWAGVGSGRPQGMLCWPPSSSCCPAPVPAAPRRPSTAFCRALDVEDEYNDVDEVAAGLLARRAGADALPPRSLQVLDDNPYEQRSRAEEQAAGAGAGGVAEGEQAAGMEVEEPAAAAPRAAPAVAAEEQGGGGKRKVRFAAGAEGYVPPSRRPGYEPLCTELPPEAGAARAPAQRRQQRGAGLSRVPDHVAHPEKYTW